MKCIYTYFCKNKEWIENINYILLIQKEKYLIKNKLYFIIIYSLLSIKIYLYNDNRFSHLVTCIVNIFSIEFIFKKMYTNIF